jgi:hypothetical protein
MFLKLLDGRGHRLEDLATYHPAAGAWMVHCWENITDSGTYGFWAGGCRLNHTQQDVHTETWDVYVPLYKTVTLEWAAGHRVIAIATEQGLLELTYERAGVKDVQYYAEGVYPSGQRIWSTKSSIMQLKMESIWRKTPSLWCDGYTNRLTWKWYEEFYPQSIAIAWEKYLASDRLVHIGDKVIEVKVLKKPSTN